MVIVGAGLRPVSDWVQLIIQPLRFNEVDLSSVWRNIRSCSGSRSGGGGGIIGLRDGDEVLRVSPDKYCTHVHPQVDTTLYIYFSLVLVIVRGCH